MSENSSMSVKNRSKMFDSNLNSVNNKPNLPPRPFKGNNNPVMQTKIKFGNATQNSTVGKQNFNQRNTNKTDHKQTWPHSQNVSQNVSINYPKKEPTRAYTETQKTERANVNNNGEKIKINFKNDNKRTETADETKNRKDEKLQQFDYNNKRKTNNLKDSQQQQEKKINFHKEKPPEVTEEKKFDKNELNITKKIDAPVSINYNKLTNTKMINIPPPPPPPPQLVQQDGKIKYQFPPSPPRSMDETDTDPVENAKCDSEEVQNNNKNIINIPPPPPPSALLSQLVQQDETTLKKQPFPSTQRSDLLSETYTNPVTNRCNGQKVRNIQSDNVSQQNHYNNDEISNTTTPNTTLNNDNNKINDQKQNLIIKDNTKLNVRSHSKSNPDYNILKGPPPIMKPPPTLEDLSALQESSMNKSSNENDKKPNNLSRMKWYFDVSKEESNRLMKENAKVGNYLVRPSDNNEHVIMVWTSDTVIMKFKIQPYQHGWMLDDRDKITHSSIPRLMVYYQENGIRRGKKHIQLKEAIQSKEN